MHWVPSSDALISAEDRFPALYVSKEGHLGLRTAATKESAWANLSDGTTIGQACRRRW